MIYDRRDQDLLRLAGAYQWLPFEALGAFDTLAPLRREIELLSNLGLLTIARSRQYLWLTPQGYERLSEWGCPYTPATKRPYAGSAALRRRLEAGSILFTCLAAGITPASQVDELGGEPTFLPAFLLRSGDGNLMNAASCAGFGHWGGTAYLIQYAGEESRGLYLTNELSHLHKLSSVFDRRLTAPNAMLLAGGSYAKLHRLLTDRTPSSRHGKQGFVDYWAAYDRLDIPVHLLSCDDVGALQLSIMAQPDYRARLAWASFGERWTATDDAIPAADGHVEGRPLVIAVDMDLRRIRRVYDAAVHQKRPEILVAALDAQMMGLILSVLPKEGNVSPLGIGPQVLETAFGKGFSARPDPNPAAGPEGALVYV